MECYTCDKLTNNYETNKATCASYREVLKLVMQVLELDPVYLSESNRNKKGRKPKLTATEQNDLTYSHENGKSMGDLSREYGVSKATIFNIIHKYIISY